MGPRERLLQLLELKARERCAIPPLLPLGHGSIVLHLSLTSIFVPVRRDTHATVQLRQLLGRGVLGGEVGVGARAGVV